jgi:broad specificity phosphatase PhoE
MSQSYLEVVLVRHGESWANLSGDYSTAHHDSLSPKGHAQAKQLAHHLLPQPFDHVLVSPLGRARETAFPYLQARQIPGLIIGDLAECCWQEPAAPGLSEPELAPSLAPLRDTEVAYYGPETPLVPSIAETWADGLRRMERVKALLWNYAKDRQRVLIIAHGYTIAILLQLCCLNPHPQPGDQKNIYIANTGISKLWIHAAEPRASICYVNRLPSFETC